MFLKLKEKFTAFKNELLSFSMKERKFIFFAMLCGFFICCEYAIIRPISNSLFIHAFSAQIFPYVWLAAIPLNFLAVALYNRFLPKWGSRKVFSVLVVSIIFSNVILALFLGKFPSLSFLLYLWKEIYIMMLFQLLWSVIHTTIHFNKAKYLYGIFFGIGGLGAIFGSAIPGFLAVSYGSENLLFLTVPFGVLLLILYAFMSKYAGVTAPQVNEAEKLENKGFFHGWRLIANSRFLIFILLIVIFMHTATAIVDFQFNNYLEKAISLKDLRTEFSARILGIIHFLTVILQFVGTYVLIQWIGFKRMHFAIPGVLGSCFMLFCAAPFFPIITLSFIAIKTFDFSVFGVIKEMLYVPLKPDEKFRAKAVIDVFASRTSKGLASLLILALQGLIIEIPYLLTWVNLVIIAAWMYAVSKGFREYEKLFSSESSI